MAVGVIGIMNTPDVSYDLANFPGVEWAADNGCFNDRWELGKWQRFLIRNQRHAHRCAFAVAPDVVGDHMATFEKSWPWLEWIRDLGYPVAFVLQNGATVDGVPWGHINGVFVGGDTEWKLGPEAIELCSYAKSIGQFVHVGRVNSYRRLSHCKWLLDADSVDGTYLRWPDTNLPKLVRMLDRVHAPSLFD